jgi:predicted metalloprotease with PDZ domain
MKIRYLVDVFAPQNSLVKVKITGEKSDQQNTLKFFLPSWSPGSYLMREYSRNIRTFKATNSKGEYLHYLQTAKGIWEVDWSKSATNNKENGFSIEYEVYCHELTVRTAHVNTEHAFLHGPAYLMGILDVSMQDPIIEFRFPPLWSKISTGLKDIGNHGDKYIYQAIDYDELIDSPVEIGCQETDGFMVKGKPHHLAFFGTIYPHPNNMKQDIQKIVETVSDSFDDLPYESYTFITHLAPNIFGGLEHLNSTVLQYDGRKFTNRKDYVSWLALVAHEYFHTWNVKRIRPKELGPFDYLNENYTRMHWLTEGLTSFMDELYVLRSGLCTLEEYLEMQKNNLQKYFETPGRKFHSLEESSFNAWIKLYRPDANSMNSSVSYYLKGGLVFSTLHMELKKSGKGIDELLTKLWERFKANPAVGVEHVEVMEMIREIGGEEVCERFEHKLVTTEEIDFDTYYKNIGCEIIWETTSSTYVGLQYEFQGDRVLVARVELDSPAYKAGFNPGDEIIAFNNQRFLKNDVDQFIKFCFTNQKYLFVISRLGRIQQVEVVPETAPRKIKEIKVVNKELAMQVFK